MSSLGPQLQQDPDEQAEGGVGPNRLGVYPAVGESAVVHAPKWLELRIMQGSEGVYPRGRVGAEPGDHLAVDRRVKHEVLSTSQRVRPGCRRPGRFRPWVGFDVPLGGGALAPPSSLEGVRLGFVVRGLRCWARGGGAAVGGVPPRGEAHQVVLALYFVPGELAARTQLPVLADFTMPQVGDRGGHVVAPVSAKGVIVAADGNDFPAGFVRIEAVKLAPGLLFSPRGARRHEVGVDGDPGGEGGAP